MKRASFQGQGPKPIGVRARGPEGDHTVEPFGPPDPARLPHLREPGALGGGACVLAAAVWFAWGLSQGVIFFYPPFLALLGVVAVGRSFARRRRPGD